MTKARASLISLRALAGCTPSPVQDAGPDITVPGGSGLSVCTDPVAGPLRPCTTAAAPSGFVPTSLTSPPAGATLNTVMPNGDLVFTGLFSDELVLGEGTPNEATLGPTENPNAFIAVQSPEGALRWARHLALGIEDEAYWASYAPGRIRRVVAAADGSLRVAGIGYREMVFSGLNCSGAKLSLAAVSGRSSAPRSTLPVAEGTTGASGLAVMPRRDHRCGAHR